MLPEDVEVDADRRLAGLDLAADKRGFALAKRDAAAATSKRLGAFVDGVAFGTCEVPSNRSHCFKDDTSPRDRQLALFAECDMPRLESRADRIEKRAHEFVTANPHVWYAFVNLCTERRDQGFASWGSKAAVEVLRYRIEVVTREEFKINNNYTAVFARWLMRDPAWAGFFQLRERPTERQRAA